MEQMVAFLCSVCARENSLQQKFIQQQAATNSEIPYSMQFFSLLFKKEVSHYIIAWRLLLDFYFYFYSSKWIGWIKRRKNAMNLILMEQSGLLVSADDDDSFSRQSKCNKLNFQCATIHDFSSLRSLFSQRNIANEISLFLPCR